ncbi:MAG: hypothetical protein GF364_22690 [Candidatus Lokiarchaeota archaeon]|nr:hypothetical protein [Candidatus Lokiarchaeota archaeon]
MSEKNSLATEPSISERFSELWQALTHNQRRFAVAMLECNTKAEAAEAINLRPDTVYRWPDAVDEVVDLMTLDAKESAVSMLTSALHKAVMVKLRGLDDGDVKVRQDSATEIMDRVLGRAKQTSEITGEDGGALVIQYINDWRNSGDDSAS